MSLDELDLLERKALAHGLMDELGIYGRMREEMLDDLERAIAVLSTARDASGARNRAALAIANFRRGADPRPATPAREELVEEAPSLSALEYAWAHQWTSPIGETLIRMMGYAIERNGGASAMLAAGWWTREAFDDLDA